MPNLIEENVIYEGPDAVLKALQESFKRTAKINEESKYHSGQIVRIKDEPSAIVNALVPAYDFNKATLISIMIAGAQAYIITPDILTDEQDNLGYYYTVEVDAYGGGFFVLPENLLEVNYD